VSTPVRPAHYVDAPLEPIVAIEAWQLNFALGNVVKYVARAGKKGPALEDLEKALWYLAREVERARGAPAPAPPVVPVPRPGTVAARLAAWFREHPEPLTITRLAAAVGVTRASAAACLHHHPALFAVTGRAPADRATGRPPLLWGLAPQPREDPECPRPRST
jgi:hypothetical protein